MGLCPYSPCYCQWQRGKTTTTVQTVFRANLLCRRVGNDKKRKQSCRSFHREESKVWQATNTFVHKVHKRTETHISLCSMYMDGIHPRCQAIFFFFHLVHSSCCCLFHRDFLCAPNSRQIFNRLAHFEPTLCSVQGIKWTWMKWINKMFMALMSNLYLYAYVDLLMYIRLTSVHLDCYTDMPV